MTEAGRYRGGWAATALAPARHQQRWGFCLTLFANQLHFCSIAIHSVGARPVHTIIWVDGTEFRWTKEAVTT